MKKAFLPIFSLSIITLCLAGYDVYKNRQPVVSIKGSTHLLKEQLPEHYGNLIMPSYKSWIVTTMLRS